jgi:hypothetical protein
MVTLPEARCPTDRITILEGNRLDSNVVRTDVSLERERAELTRTVGISKSSSLGVRVGKGVSRSSCKKERETSHKKRVVYTVLPSLA